MNTIHFTDVLHRRFSAQNARSVIYSLGLERVKNSIAVEIGELHSEPLTNSHSYFLITVKYTKDDTKGSKDDYVEKLNTLLE
jgi:hypothetical protein